MQPNRVFTPRNVHVNRDMYIPRVDLETRLLESVLGSTHTILHGESGNGKTWLYRKVLEQNQVSFEVVNCANISRLGSVADRILDAALPDDSAEKTEYTEKKEASLSMGIGGGKLEHSGRFVIRSKDPLKAAFQIFSSMRSDKDRPFVLVLDNLEVIFKHPQLMSELANIVLLLDDKSFAKFKVKLLIVGTPSDILDYFSSLEDLDSISNRLEELPKVDSLTPSMVSTLVTTGFNKLLKWGWSATDLSTVSRQVHHVTLGIAQCVHEYCFALASIIGGPSRRPTVERLAEANDRWLETKLRKSYAVMQKLLSEKPGARRNQILFCIGRTGGHQFDAAEVKELMEEFFPKAMKTNKISIAAAIGEIASIKPSLIVKSNANGWFRVTDPRYLMCLRVALWVDNEAETVGCATFVI